MLASSHPTDRRLPGGEDRGGRDLREARDTQRTWERSFAGSFFNSNPPLSPEVRKCRLWGQSKLLTQNCSELCNIEQIYSVSKPPFPYL